MKKSQDKPMADMSKVSHEREPMVEKKGHPEGSGVASGIGPMGPDTHGNMSGVERSGPAYESSYKGDIGKGDGGPTIDKMGPDNPGHAL